MSVFGDSFLINPDLFPARRSGEAWGSREIALALPGGPYRFSGLNADQKAAVRERFGAYCGTDGLGTPAIESVLFRAAEADFRAIDVRGWEYALDLDATPEAVRLAGLRLVGRLDWRPRLAGALWTPDGGGAAFAGIFENFLRVLVAYRLHELGGAVLHCAAVASPRGARLFLGRSGAGKSTVSRLAQEHGAQVLSDDLNALRLKAGAVTVEKLPFTGDYGDPRTPSPAVPLAGLYRLEKDTVDALRPLSRAETVACLLACSPYVNADSHRRDELFSDLLLLAPAQKAWSLRFSLDGGFWPILG
ncbi:MAG TPA: hypothetical protein VH988_08865 [Thermoanaerobaculia bacterium]|nr:hypothetical protein [Thermoanaerobaculia bacterium]